MSRAYHHPAIHGKLAGNPRTAPRRYVVTPWPPREGSPPRWSVQERYHSNTNHRPAFTHLVTLRGTTLGCTCQTWGCAHVRAVNETL